MPEEKKDITPQPGEYWLQAKKEGQVGELVGFVFMHPITQTLMLAGNYFNPFPVKAEMIHGKNRWYRVYPPVMH